MADQASIIANVISGSSVVGGSGSGAEISTNVTDEGNNTSTNVIQGNPVNSDNTNGAVVQTSVNQGVEVQSSVTTGAKGDKGDTGATGPVGPAGPQGDPGEGVPAGGLTGQLLTKSSGADFDTEWADNTAISESLVIAYATAL